jgi:hypothetical protein
VPIIGSAVIDPFQKYELHFKQEPSGDDAYIYFTGGTTPIVGGQLGVWQAGGLPPGNVQHPPARRQGRMATTPSTYSPNLSVNPGRAPAPRPRKRPGDADADATFTPAPQPTPVIGQVTQPWSKMTTRPPRRRLPWRRSTGATRGGRRAAAHAHARRRALTLASPAPTQRQPRKAA